MTCYCNLKNRVIDKYSVLDHRILKPTLTRTANTIAREHWPLKFTEPSIPLNKLYSGVPIIGLQSLDVRSK